MKSTCERGVDVKPHVKPHVKPFQMVLECVLSSESDRKCKQFCRASPGAIRSKALQRGAHHKAWPDADLPGSIDSMRWPQTREGELLNTLRTFEKLLYT